MLRADQLHVRPNQIRPLLEQIVVFFGERIVPYLRLVNEHFEFSAGQRELNELFVTFILFAQFLEVSAAGLNGNHLGAASDEFIDFLETEKCDSLLGIDPDTNGDFFHKGLVKELMMNMTSV